MTLSRDKSDEAGWMDYRNDLSERNLCMIEREEEEEEEGGSRGNI